ncbi:MAG TPA: hypothetical protein VFO58_22475 [Vicinamibacterales bacterium]|nr:hypothetical protein [Vicinamibacterales bacterium]
MSDSTEAARVLSELSTFGPVLAVKVYRIALDPVPAVPLLPCLDHEAMLHEGVAPHVAAYLQEASSGDLHEIVLTPAARRIDIDAVSTWGECSPESQARLSNVLARTAPGFRIAIAGPSWWRGDRRVAAACRAQVSLRDVLLGADMAGVRAGIDRLLTISALMEKQSRVASWGARTVTGPLLAAAGVMSYFVVGSLAGQLGDAGVTTLRYALISLLGACFLYYGLKAVQLTGMSNRVWKRTAEYNLILSERRRLGK